MADDRDETEDYLEHLQKQSQFEPSVASTGLAALFLAALPLFLYHAVLQFPVTENVPVYGGTTAVATVLLALAYQKLASRRFQVLAEGHHGLKRSESHKQLGFSSEEELREAEADLRRSEAFYHSLFINNLIFVVLFLFLGFYALASMSLNYNYPCAVAGSAAIVWQLSEMI